MTSCAVDRGRLRAGGQAGRVEAQAHRAALVLHVALVGHEVDDRVLGEHVELGRVGVRACRATSRANSMTAHWRPRQRPEVRDPLLARVVGGEDLALDAAMAEAAGDEDPGRARRARSSTFSGVSASESTQRTLASTPCAQAGVAERLGDREVGVGQLDVLADEGDLEGRLGRA